MSLLVTILLILVGLILLVLEILVIPGFIAGLVGGLMMIGGIWGVYHTQGFFYGNIALISTLIISILSLWLVLKSNTWKKMALHTHIDGRVNSELDDQFHVGDNGMSISRLAPMGKAQFGDHYCEVQAREGWIDQGVEIEIYKIIDKKIIVTLKN